VKGGVILSLDESKKWIDKLRDDITRKIRERDIKEIIFYAGKTSRFFIMQLISAVKTISNGSRL